MGPYRSMLNAEQITRPGLAARSVTPGRYCRDASWCPYFEGIDSERDLEWRRSDALSLREFLRLENRERLPDHSWPSKMLHAPAS